MKRTQKLSITIIVVVVLVVVAVVAYVMSRASSQSDTSNVPPTNIQIDTTRQPVQKSPQFENSLPRNSAAPTQ